MNRAKAQRLERGDAPEIVDLSFNPTNVAMDSDEGFEPFPPPTKSRGRGGGRGRGGRGRGRGELLSYPFKIAERLQCVPESFIEPNINTFAPIVGR